MNRTALRLAVVLSLGACAVPGHAAGDEAWGLWRYAPPAAEAGAMRADVRSWQLVRGGSFCQFSLFAAVGGGGDAAAGFRSEWSVLGAGRGASSAPPEPRIVPAANGWTRGDGSADERTERVGRYRLRQVTFVGHGRSMSATVADNDAALCRQAGDAFLAGLVPQQPADVADRASAASAASPAIVSTPSAVGALPPLVGPSADAENPARAPALTAQSWRKATASYSHWGLNPSPGEMAKLFAGQGYSARTWQFAPDGRYRYRWEVWSLSSKPKELSGMEETGRWRQSGDRLVVEPERSVAYVEDEATGRRLVEQPARSGRTEYATRMHWLSGMRQWYLVLAPTDGRPTARDGDFHGQPGFPSAYLYGPPQRANLIR